MKRNLITLMLLTLSFSFIWTGCSDDTTNPGGGGGSSIPVITLKPNSVYTFTNDSLTFVNPGGNDTAMNRKRMAAVTTDIIQTERSVDGKNCFPVISTTTSGSVVKTDTFYLSYESASGKLWQYGINHMIDTSQARKWDLLSDFALARGTSWNIGTLKYRYNIGLITGTAEGPLSGKVADSLVFVSTGTSAKQVNAYRIELIGDLKDNATNATAKIYLDYYIGFSNSSIAGNPPGVVRLTLKPFRIFLSGNPVYSYPGFDRIISGWTIP